jgi:hypothetical protein
MDANPGVDINNLIQSTRRGKFDDEQWSKMRERFDGLYGDPRFYDLIVDIALLHSRKAHDYTGGGPDALRNLRAATQLGLKAYDGVLIRLQDKWSRILSLAPKRHQDRYYAVLDESLEDTHFDNAVYNLFEIILLREEVWLRDQDGAGHKFRNMTKAEKDRFSKPVTTDKDY